MNAISRGRSHRPQRATSRWAIPITVAFVAVLVWPAGATALETEATTDDVTGTVEETTEVVEGAVEETTETVNEVVDDLEGAVTETVEDTTETVNETVSGEESSPTETSSEPSATTQSSDSETSASSGSTAPTGTKSKESPKAIDSNTAALPSGDAPRASRADTAAASGSVAGSDGISAASRDGSTTRTSTRSESGLDVAAALVRAEPPVTSAFLIEARPTPMDLFGSVVSGGRAIDGIAPPLSRGVVENAVTLAIMLLFVAAVLVAIGRATLSWDSRGSFAS